MALSVLVPVVVAAVVLVAALSWALGGSRAARLDPETARQRFLVDHPEARIVDLAVAEDGASALLWLGTEAGLVFAVGDRFATRLLGDARVEQRHGALRVVFGDLATPPVRVAVDPSWWEGVRG